MNEWISVEDKLPQAGEGVLVYSGDRGVVVDYLIPNVAYAEPAYFFYGPADHFDNSVTHWMPLPGSPGDN